MKLGHGRFRWVAISATLIAGTGIGYSIHRAIAAGIPASMPMTYSGVLTDSANKPLTGSQNIQLSIYDMATGGTLQCSVGPSAVTLVNGTFQIPLSSACTTAIHATPDLWLEVFVGGASLGRSKLGAVPYAVESAHAVSADTANAAGGTLASTISGLSSNVTALQAVKPLTSIGVEVEVVPGDTYYSDCTSPSSATIFPAGACARMAQYKCVAVGYVAGWFEGDLHGSNPLVDCIK
jgi:hypothetical protein